MIVLTAATGQVGNAALHALASGGSPIRAIVRDPSTFSAPSGVQVLAGDFDDEVSLAGALDGACTLFLAGRDSPGSVSQHRRVLAQARRAGVGHVVKLSAIGASPTSNVALMREHHEVDEEVRQGPWGWTLLKPHLFMQNLLRAVDMVRREGRIIAPMGQGSFPLVDTRDVGAAAAAVLADPAAHSGRDYALTGPEPVNYDQVAAAIAATTGHAVRYEAAAPVDVEARLRSSGMPDWRAFDLAHIASAYTAADNLASADLARLLGRPPRSLAQFLQDHRDSFV